MTNATKCLMLSGALALAACGSDGIGPGGPSWFRASLQGEVAGSFEGSGNFSFQRDHADTPAYFTIYARGADQATDEEVFYIRWPSTSRPPVGSHPLVPYDHGYGSTTGVTAFYGWRRGDNVSAPVNGEVYVASGGVVEITASTREAVEGTLHFTGIQVSRYGSAASPRQDPPHRPDPTAPTIEVSGTFRVTYWPGFGSP